MFNKNNPHVRNLPLSLSLSLSLSLCVFVLCRVLRLHFLRATNLSWVKRYVLSIEYECNLQAVCTRSVDICPTSYIHSFLKWQTNERGMRGKGREKIIYPGQHIARSVCATKRVLSCVRLQCKRGTMSNVCDAVSDVLKTIQMLHVFFEL